ncbi:MAG TPA: S41 family peptidase, partial [Legionellaceae bacterium]|nr:S41 family peptidase [Legionellaceae bacterium]
MVKNTRCIPFVFSAIALSLSLSLHAIPSRDFNEEDAAEQQIPMEDVQRFSNAISLIKKYYVKETDDKVLFDNAIRGMLSGLDPHSAYLDEDDFKELQTATNGEFGGLGIEVTIEEGVIKVITPLVDTPAFKSGIKSGDYIIKIDKQYVQGLELKDAVNMMRGKPGTSIKLTVIRKGVSKPLIFNVLREKIEIKSVKQRLLDNKYGYVRLTQFQAMTDKDMVAAINELKKQAGGTLKGLILDLRNNPGGLLDSAIQISGSFLNKEKNGKKEMIVYTQGRLPGSKFTAMANSKDILNN